MVLAWRLVVPIKICPNAGMVRQVVVYVTGMCVNWINLEHNRLTRRGTTPSHRIRNINLWHTVTSSSDELFFKPQDLQRDLRKLRTSVSA